MKYVQTCGKYSLDSIDTFVFEIGHNLAKNLVVVMQKYSAHAC